MPQKITPYCWCWVLIFFIASPLKSQILETATQYADLEFNATGDKIDVVNSELVYGGFDHDQVVFIDKGNQGMAAIIKIGSELSTTATLRISWVSVSGTFSMTTNGAYLFDGSGVPLSETPISVGDELILAIDGEYIQYLLNNEILDTRNIAEVSGEIEAQFSGAAFPDGKIQVGIAPYTIDPIPEVSFTTAFQSIYAGQEIEVCAALNYPNQFSNPLVAQVRLVSAGDLLPGFSTQQISFLPGESQFCFSLPTNATTSDPQARVRLALSITDSLRLMLGQPDTMEIALRPDISPPVSLVFTAFDNQSGGVGNAETDQMTMTTLQELLPGSIFYLVKGTSVEDGVWDGQQPAIQKVTYEGSTIIPTGSTICFSIPATCDGDAFLANGFTVNGQSADFLVSSFGGQVAPDINLMAGESSSLSIVQGSWTFEEGRTILNGQTVTSLSLGASVSDQGATNALPGIESNTSQYGFFTCDQTASISVEQLRTDIAQGANWTILAGTADNDLPGEVCTASCPVLDAFPPPVWVSLPDTLFIDCQVLDPQISIDQWLQSNGEGSVISEFCGSEIEVFNTYNEELAYACGEEGMVVTFIARDTCGGLAMANAPIILLNNEAPEFQVLPQDTTIACMPDTLLATTFQDWLDRHGGASVTANCGVDWTYTYQWLQDCPEENTQAIVTFFATDYCGQSVSHTVNFIIDPAISWTLLAAPTSLSLNLGEANFNIKLDQWLANQAYIGLDYHCSTLSWSHNYTGALDSICGTTDVVFSALSACGDTYQFSSRLTVADTIVPELVTPPQDLEIACWDDSGALIGWLNQFAGATVSDNQGIDNLEWRALTDTDTLLSGPCFDKTVWFEVRDFCGNVLRYSAQLMRSDSIPPRIRTAGGEQISDETVLYSNISTSKEALLNNWLSTNAGLVISDNCTPTTEIEVSYVLLNSGPDDHYVYELIFTDQCGNSSTVSRSVQLIDNTPPLLSGGVDLYLVCDTEQQMASQIDNWLAQNAFITFTDQSAVSVSHNFSATESCFNQEVIFTFTDEAGNQSFQKQQIIQDVRAPKISLPNALDTMSLMAFSCNQALVSLAFRVEDACVQDWNWIDHTSVQAISNTGESLVPDWEEATQVSSDSVELSFLLPVGDYTLDIQVIDKCGNAGAISKNLSISDLPIDCTPTFEVAKPLVIRKSAVDYQGRLTFLQDSLQSLSHQISFACSADTSMILRFESVAIRGLNHKALPSSLFSADHFCVEHSAAVEVYAQTACGEEYIALTNLQFINDEPLELIRGPQDSTLILTDYESLASWIGFTAAGELSVKPYEDWLKNYGGAEVSTTCGLNVGFEILSDESCLSSQVAYLDRLVAFTFTDASGVTLVDTARFVLDHDFRLMMQYPRDTLVTMADFESGSFDRANWLDHGIIQDSCNYLVVDSLWVDSIACVDNPNVGIWNYYRTIEDKRGRMLRDTMQLTVPNGALQIVSPAVDTLVSPEEDWIALANAWMYDDLAGFRVDDTCREVQYSVDTLAFIDCPNRTLRVAFSAMDLVTQEVLMDTAEFVVDGFISQLTQAASDQWSTHVSDYQSWKEDYGGLRVTIPCEAPVYSVLSEQESQNDNCGFTTYEVIFRAQTDNGGVILDTASFVLYQPVPDPQLMDSTYYVSDSLSYASVPAHQQWAASINVLETCSDLYTMTHQLLDSTLCVEDPTFGTWTYQLTTRNVLTGTTRQDTVSLAIIDVRPAFAGGILFDQYMVHDGTNDAEISAAIEDWKNTFPGIALSRVGCKEVEVIEYVPEEFVASCAVIIDTSTHIDPNGNTFTLNKGELHTVHLLKMRIENELGEVISIYSKFYEIYPAQSWLSEAQDTTYAYQGGGIVEIQNALQNWIANHGGANTISPCPNDHPVVWSHDTISIDTDEAGFGSYTIRFIATVQGTNRQLTTQANFIVEIPCNTFEVITDPTDLSCYGGQDGSVFTIINGGMPDYSYLWSNGATTANISNIESGTYAVTVTDGNGCTATGSVTVSEPSALSVSISRSNVTCSGGNDGSVLVNVSGGTSGYSYQWNTGSTSSSLSNLSAGTYSVTVTDSNGCTAMRSVTVSEPSALSVSISRSNVTCSGGNDGRATVSVSGGSSGYSYQWSTGSTGSSISNLSAGTYSVTVTDGNGCTATSSVTITAPSALSVSVSKTNVTCNGGTDGIATVSASGGSSGYSYQWSTGSTSSSISNLSAGTYSVTVTDGNDCTATRSVTITAPSALSVSVSKTNVSCHGGTDGIATVSASGGSSGYSYRWSTGSTSSSISNLSVGTYSVTVTDGNDCTATRSVTITAPSALSVSVSKTNVSCHGGTDGIATVSASGGSSGYSYQWSTGSTSSSISNLSAGTYSVTVTDGNGCTATGSVTVSEPSALSVSISRSNVTCSGGNDGSATVNVSGGSSGYSYQWSTGSTNSSINNLSAGTYSVTVTDGNGCTATRSVTVSEPSALSVSISRSNVTCSGGNDGSAWVNVSGGTSDYSYRWNTGSISSSISNLSTGTYSVTVTDSNDCTATSSVTITAPSALSVSVSKTNVSCSGGNDGSAWVNVSGGTSGYSYQWNTGSTSSSLSNLSAGTYRVTVTDGNGCTATRSVTVSEPSTLSVSVSKTNVSCSGGNDGSASVNVSGGTSGYSYQWNTGSTSSSLSNLSAGTYRVTVTDAAGCTIVEETLITQTSSIGVNAFITNPCYGGGDNGGITVSAVGGTPGYSYLWSTGATGSSISGINKGVYSVTITDANSCSVSKSYEVLESPALEINVNKENVDCFGAQTGSINLNINGGSSPYTYSWNTGATSNSLSNLGAGIYRVTVTDARDCSAIKEIQISQPLNLGLNSQTILPACYGDNTGEINVSGTGGTPGYSYQWSNGASGDRISGLSSGIYSVTATDANGCTAVRSLSLSEPPPLNISYSKNDIECYGTYTGSISLNVSGGTGGYDYQWSNGATSSTINALGAGDYSVTVTDAQNCQVNETITIRSTIAMSLASVVNPETCDGANDGSIEVAAQGGLGPYQYSWSNGGQNSIIANLAAGRYSVTVTDQNDCSLTQSFLVSSLGSNCTFLSTPKGINSLAQTDQNLRLFPNPTANDVFLEYQNPEAASTMEVEFYDKAGRLLKQVKQEIYKGHNRFSVPTWDLPPGLYIVRTKAGQDIQVKKLIVVKN